MTDEATERWFYGSEGRRRGPVSRSALVDLLLTEETPESTLVWCAGFPEWRPASEVPELRRELPPPLPLPAPEAALSRAALELDDREPPTEEEAPPEVVEEANETPVAPVASTADDRHRRKRLHHRHHLRKAEEAFIASRAQRAVLVWAWPIILLTAVVVWLLLNRVNREPEAPMMLEPASSFDLAPSRFRADFLEEPLPQTAPERYTHANATRES